MTSQYIEQRTLQASNSLSRDLARHLYVRQFCGPVVVVTDRPGVTMPSVKRQWHKVERRAARERSSTLVASRIAVLSRMVSVAQRTRFATQITDEALGPTVLFMSARELLKVPVPCRTLYVACEIGNTELSALRQAVTNYGVIVTYV